MKVISIGTDRKLFEENSNVLSRNIGYATKMEELHIVVFSLKSLGLEPKNIGNLFIYPTNSNSKLNYILDAYRICKKIANNSKLNNTSKVVVSTQDPFETGLVGYLLKRKFGFPLQIQSHTDLFSPNFNNSFLNRIRLIIAKFLIPKISGFRVVSESVKKSIELKFPNLKNKIDVLPVFVNVEKLINIEPDVNIKNKFSNFKFKILVASRLTKEKKINIALLAFKKVITQFSYAGLIIAGDGSERIELENLTKKLDLSDNVTFVGWQDDLISYYKTADIFLCTSEYEGYGMTLIEAGACGCPIVTTKVGIANSDLFISGKNCYICAVNDVEGIFKSTIDLMVDNSKRELFKQEMQDSIKNIMTSEQEYTNRYVSLLEKLLQ